MQFSECIPVYFFIYYTEGIKHRDQTYEVTLPLKTMALNQKNILQKYPISLIFTSIVFSGLEMTRDSVQEICFSLSMKYHCKKNMF